MLMDLCDCAHTVQLVKLWRDSLLLCSGDIDDKNRLQRHRIRQAALKMSCQQAAATIIILEGTLT